MGQWLTPTDLNKYSEIISEHIDDPNQFKIFIETGTAYGQTLQQIQYNQQIYLSIKYIKQYLINQII